MSQEAVPQVKNTVVYMAEFLMTRRNAIVTEANALYEKATKLSKHPDPRQDPFAGVLTKKVDAMAETVGQIEKHIKFIVRGGLNMVIPQAPPAPVNISIAHPSPTT